MNDTTFGIVRATYDSPLDAQIQTIHRLCGEILCEDVSRKDERHIVKILIRMHRSGFTTVVVTKITHLSREWSYLQTILLEIYTLGMELQVIDDDRIVTAEMARVNDRITSFSIEGVDWIRDVILVNGISTKWPI